MHLVVVFRLLQSVHLLESLFKHPEVLCVQHVHLHCIEYLEESVTFLEDLGLVFICHFLVSVACCSRATAQMTEGESRFGLAT